MPVEEDVGHLERAPVLAVGGPTPGRWPPLTSTQAGPEPVEATGDLDHVVDVGQPWRVDAGQHGRLPQVGRDDQGVGQQVAPVGVDAVVVEQGRPVDATITGSTTRLGQVAGGGPPADHLDGLGRVPSIPVFTAATGQVVEHGGDLLRRTMAGGTVVDGRAPSRCSGR